jgi:hypothetical protein
VRGTDASFQPVRVFITGTPPRAGERRHTVQSIHPVRRFTPACGGQTSSTSSRCALRADHPRVRGTDGLPVMFVYVLYGSPPRAGERQRLPVDAPRGDSITPACGGETCVGAASFPAISDHPRVRGRDLIAHLPNTPSVGSSPHAGERRGLRSPVCRHGRITPAYGGQTSTPRGTRTQSTDHPRVRGTDANPSTRSRYADRDRGIICPVVACLQPSDIAQNLSVRVCHRKVAA